jgi:hypothetical protein
MAALLYLFMMSIAFEFMPSLAKSFLIPYYKVASLGGKLLPYMVEFELLSLTLKLFSFTFIRLGASN